MEFIVDSQEHGLSLLTFLTQKCKGTFSVKKIKKAIDAKSCFVNGKVEFFSSFLIREGDKITFRIPSLSQETSKPDRMPILFEDQYFAVIDKRPGVVCEPAAFKQKQWILIHRLDKDTSGLLLVAKSLEAAEAGKALFHQREIQKMYLAIVDGIMKGKKGVIENYLEIKREYQGQTIYGASKSLGKGLKAITHWQVLTSNKNASLVLCDLKTGRTHQIRVHLSEKGHPILGDYQYATKPFISDFHPKRHLLHAWKLCFIHPFTHKKIEIESPIPLDFSETLSLFGVNFDFIQ